MSRQNIINKRNGHIISSDIRYADTWIKRLIGLLSANSLQQGSAMWLMPCKSIHTIGMRFPIDVIFLDSHHRVRKLESRLMPYRLCLAAKGVCSVLELPAGTIALNDIHLGDKLLLQCR